MHVLLQYNEIITLSEQKMDTHHVYVTIKTHTHPHSWWDTQPKPKIRIRGSWIENIWTMTLAIGLGRWINLLIKPIIFNLINPRIIHYKLYVCKCMMRFWSADDILCILWAVKNGHFISFFSLDSCKSSHFRKYEQCIVVVLRIAVE